MCVISQKGQDVSETRTARSDEKEKSFSLFQGGKTLLMPKVSFLSRRIKRDENRGRRDRFGILCGKDDRAVLNRKKKISASIFF